jgi:hypothetical protein
MNVIGINFTNTDLNDVKDEEKVNVETNKEEERLKRICKEAGGVIISLEDVFFLYNQGNSNIKSI